MLRLRSHRGRREFLRIGGASALGLGLPNLLAAKPPHRSRSCIFIYLAGGPSQLETFDPKPDAPLGVRSPWGTVATSVPGTRFCDLLPQLADQAHRFSLIRTLHHTNTLHQPWPMLTGHPDGRTTHGAAVTHLRRAPATALPHYIHLGAKLSVGGGALGANFDPLAIANPVEAAEALSRFTLSADVPADRLLDRRGLLQEFDALRPSLDRVARPDARDEGYQRAFAVLTSPAVRDAFDLGREPTRLRDRYGANCFGQSCLLARRLIEAGTQFVEIAWYDREDGFAVGWDVHGDDVAGLSRMEQQLCPRFDQGLSMLLTDLSDHGLLDSTLVVAVGEFGRTPSLSRLGGRDHWPYCFSALLAGAGVPGGAVIGRSDKAAARPADRPVSAADFAATLCRILGVDPSQDDRTRPMVLGGQAVDELVRA